MDLRLFLSCGSSRWLDILSLGFFFPVSEFFFTVISRWLGREGVYKR